MTIWGKAGWRCVLRLWSIPVLAVSFVVAQGAYAQSTSTKLQLGGYEQALRLMEQGQCGKAQEKMAPQGRTEPGDEVALSDIGNCYITAAKKIQDPEAAQRSRELGAGWILRAANMGVRRAAEEMVRLYLNDSIFIKDPYEAAKWYFLWSANHSQMQLGQIEFDPDLMKQMNASFTADQWDEGKARAVKWRPITSAQYVP